MCTSSCPFCDIASTYPPVAPTNFAVPSTPNSSNNGDQHAASPSPPVTISDGSREAHLILSTKHVLAFLDIMPLTRGHVLVVPRQHYEKLSEVGVGMSREIGQWLPILSRTVLKTLFGEDPDNTQWHWNVVQNNGVRAAQQVPHVHFHIIPRPPSEPTPNAAKVSWVMFGRGQRDELDDDEGEALARVLREELAREVRRVRDVEGVDLDLDLDLGRSGEGRKGKL
ncbi:HIT-like domain-containing protein [Aspergillus taichungensis]|uniref:HIT-like domain-containing protein n=1 Tax=Aspergillus taichungensis TaxID=482145 RepID=A0A2J5I6B6_9EURO|nr:HIT-like domain-containing protein [Aspergillus taichungensis]